MATPKRPLSPFMIGPYYRPQITSMMSILHRATGVANAIGGLLVAVWLSCLAGSPDDYAAFMALMSSPVGKLALFVFSATLVYHLLNGVRHLFWDMGRGFEIPQVYRSGYLVIALAIGLTGLLWYAGLSAGGGA